jgi:tetratricopeptide (TPR) repeat protein
MVAKNRRFRLIKPSLVLLFFMVFLKLGFGQNISGNKRSESPDLKRLENLIIQDKENYNSEFIKLEKRYSEKDQKDKLLDIYLFQVNQLVESLFIDSALVYLHKSKNLYRNLKEKELIPVYLSFASIFHSKGDIDSLLYYQGLAKQVINEKSSFYGHYLLNQALVSGQNSDHKQAIELIFEAIKLLEKEQDFKKLAVAYNNLAFNYERLGDLDTQIKYLQKAVVLNKELGNTYHLIMNYNNLGSTHRQKDLLVDAIAYYDSAFVQLEKLYNPLQMAQNILNRANIYKRKGDVDVAEPLYLQALSICEANNISYGEMLCKINLGDLYRQTRQYEKSREILASALDLSLQLKAKREEALIYEKQAWLARDLADFSTAYYLLDKYYVLNDSLVNESVRKEANALRENYEVEKKENQILRLSKDKLLQQLVIAGMAIGLLVAILLLQGWRNKIKLLKKESQKQELIRNHLKEVISNKDNELLDQASQIMQIQDHFESVKKKVLNILLDGSFEANKLKKIENLLNKKSIEEIKNDFELKLTAINESFFKNLIQSFPNLSPAELKLCAYLRLNLSTKEIAGLMHRSIRTIEDSRANIRKKLNLTPQDNLVTYLLKFALENEIEQF